MRKILSTVICVVLSVFICAFFPCNQCFSALSKNDAGTATAQFLKLGSGARASAIGDAYTGIADDATCVYWNPAGLNKLQNKELSLMYAFLFEDVSYSWFSYVQPTGLGNFGVGAQYLSYGSIKGTDTDGVGSGSFKPSDMAISVCYGCKIANVSVGASIKYISSKINDTATAIAADIGSQLQILDSKLQIGLTVKNIGTKMNDEQLPMRITLGSGYKIKDNLLVALDVNLPDDNEISFALGSEYKYKISDEINIAGRVGYNTLTKDISGLKGISAGIGLEDELCSMDYAFVPFGVLGDTHRVSLGMKF